MRGRPTDYSEAVLHRAQKYLAYHKNADMEAALPSIASLALELKCNRSTIYEWAKIHPEFSNILDDILSLQEDKLLRNGLMNRWNPTITKLVLGKHGYREGIDHTTDGKALPTPILNGISSNDGSSKDTAAH